MARHFNPRPLTNEERDARRQADRERIEQAARALLTSEGWQRWVRLRSRAGLARLSLSNQLLVALAKPDATFVAGFKAWLQLGYCVRKGEKAIRIIAPMPIKQRDRTSGEETGETITLFKGVSVFDAQQVQPLPSGQPTPLQPPSQPLTGDSHAHLIAPAIAFAESLGYTVTFESIPGSAGGWCDPKHNKIAVDSDVAPNARLRTLVHEAIHALGVDYQQYPRAQAEVIVDTTTLGRARRPRPGRLRRHRPIRGRLGPGRRPRRRDPVRRAHRRARATGRSRTQRRRRRHPRDRRGRLKRVRSASSRHVCGVSTRSLLRGKQARVRRRSARLRVVRSERGDSAARALAASRMQASSDSSGPGRGRIADRVCDRR
jgi:hypothetical protein